MFLVNFNKYYQFKVRSFKYLPNGAVSQKGVVRQSLTCFKVPW